MSRSRQLGATRKMSEARRENAAPLTGSVSSRGNLGGTDTSVAGFDAQALVEAHQRRTRQAAVRTRIAQVLILIALLGAWELTSRYLIDAFWISSPGAVIEQAWD